jgi:glycosyltransferase involved in cell wall biosynthesis
LPIKKWVKAASQFRILYAIKQCANDLKKSFYERIKLRILKKAAQRLGDHLHIVTHTKRERKFFECLHGFKNIYDHPLSNMRTGWLNRLMLDGGKYRRTLKERFGGNAKLVACFGFISPYKGLETAIDAISLLPPEDYKLLIYGSIHPETIQRNTGIDVYLASLLSRLGYKLSSEGKAAPRKKAPIFARKMVSCETTPIQNVFFMGSLDDYEFVQAIDSADFCVFPYLETGQSASGPVSIAIELKKNTLLSHSRVFRELRHYFPNCFEMFDIGNYVQLSQLLQREEYNKVNDLPYTMETQKQMYLNIIDTLSAIKE